MNLNRKRKANKSANGYHAIVKHIRDDIRSARLAPGARLPTRRELQQHYSTTPVTVNRAMMILAEHGFVESQGRNGTFVTRYPPHIAHFAIAFPWGTNPPPSRFFQAIEKEAAKLRDPERYISMFYEIDRHADAADHQRLLGMVKAHRLAGLIFANNPVELEDTPLFKNADLPRVGVALPNPKLVFPTVYPKVDSFMERAFAHLAARGRRRVAVVLLASIGGPGSSIYAMQAIAGRHGLTIQPWWVQGVSFDSPLWARQVLFLMFQGRRKAERPDALVITDDNFVEPATLGVQAAGVAVPRDLEIVAMTNFPWPMPSAVPVTRLGYDVTRLVGICIRRLEEQRRGRPARGHTSIPAVFEAELAGAAKPAK